ncbi:MAG: hypothetical protein L6R40_006729 [Gallowayella cf. fulva]|nr:MAG: hypothetical protein L6R40_006729 [Xanthomendoza cf. fulva]
MARESRNAPSGDSKIAGFMDSEDTVGIYRRFGFLYSHTSSPFALEEKPIQRRVDRLVTLLISGIMLVLLVIPTYALYRVTNLKEDSTTNAKCIGILLVATLIFSAVLSLFTKAKRHEILGASAAIRKEKTWPKKVGTNDWRECQLEVTPKIKRPSSLVQDRDDLFILWSLS